MATTFDLGSQFEHFIEGELASGRYDDASEVIRDALRLLQDKRRRLAALDDSIVRGIDDADRGCVIDADVVFDDLDAELETPSDPRR